MIQNNSEADNYIIATDYSNHMKNRRDFDE